MLVSRCINAYFGETMAISRPTMILVLTVALTIASILSGQDKKISPKANMQLKPWLDLVKKGTDEVVQDNDGGFYRKKQLAFQVRGNQEISRYADKPYAYKINWTNVLQESKIYKSEEEAKKGSNWLKPGVPVINPSARYADQIFNVTLYYDGKGWILDDVVWASASGVGSLKRGNNNAWVDALVGLNNKLNSLGNEEDKDRLKNDSQKQKN